MAGLAALIEIDVEANIELVTRCSSADEFVERFARFTTESDIVVPALPHVAVGSAGHFTIRLRDRSVVMTGRCEVSEIRHALVATAAGAAPTPAGPALMRLHVREMDAHSCGIHLRLMERHAVSRRPVTAPAERAVTAPVPPAHAVTAPPVLPERAVVAPPVPQSSPIAPGLAPAAEPVDQVSKPAIVTVGPLPAETEKVALPPPARTEARVPGAALTLPANPLGDLDAADLASFIEGTLHEVHPGGARAGANGWIQALERARRMAPRAAGYVSCVLLGVFLGIAFRSGSAAAPVTATPSPASPSSVAPPPAEPLPTDERPARGQGDCVARVTTTPAGAAVRWGDIELGPSPIENVSVPCGAATVAIRRQHYSDVTRAITAEPGQAASIDQRLHRPPANLVVTSAPSHALIKLNGRRFGLTPHKVSTLRFEHVRIEASLPGYRPWKKTVYLKDEESTVEVTLARLPQASGRHAAAPAPAMGPVAARTR